MNFMKKNLALTIVVLILIVGGGWSLLNQSQAKKTTAPITQSEQKKTVVTVKVNDGTNEVSYPLTSGVGQTALEVTGTATGGKIVTSGTGTNAFVTSINGRVADSSKREYWNLVVNGKASDVGAGSYTVKENDTISWQIATY